MDSENSKALAVSRQLSKEGDRLVSDHPFLVADRIGFDIPTAEESLVVDARSGLSPAQVVETKLTRVLKEATMPISHLQMRGLLRSR